MVAGLILAGFEHLDRLGLEKRARRVLDATGAGRAHAYAYRRRVLELGRPGKPEPYPTTDAAAVITREVLEFLMTHPGAVCARDSRNWYSDALRAFVLGLGERHIGVDLGVFAGATNIPLGTLEDWITRGGKPKRQPGDPADLAPANAANPKPSNSATSPSINSSADPNAEAEARAAKSAVSLAEQTELGARPSTP